MLAYDVAPIMREKANFRELYISLEGLSYNDSESKCFKSTKSWYVVKKKGMVD